MLGGGWVGGWKGVALGFKEEEEDGVVSLAGVVGVGSVGCVELVGAAAGVEFWGAKDTPWFTKWEPRGNREATERLWAAGDLPPACGIRTASLPGKSPSIYRCAKEVIAP